LLCIIPPNDVQQ